MAAAIRSGSARRRARPAPAAGQEDPELINAGKQYVTLLPGGAFFDIRDDRIARVTNYYNLQDWVRQVRPDSP